ncbi:MAG TPA: PTS transporter subunit EIIA [Candidatus Hydrogenedentes bacterium]|nr:PTS transporter subunit EIIA [Candidatus Hydrogenedentota bacterium]
MHYLNEDHVLLFLIQVLVLLVFAKILGGLCQRRGIPALAGEILAGILLGPTVFGRILPSFQRAIFPPDVTQVTMLETVSWFGVLFLLLATGFEVDISTVWKQGKSALLIGIVGVLVPLGIGALVFPFVSAIFWGSQATRLSFTLFLATAASITAISVVARVIYDLDITKSDVGLVSLSSCAVNDLFGWLVFTIVLALAASAEQQAEQPFNPGQLLLVLSEIVLFGAVCLTVGSKVFGALTTRLKGSALPQPATTLTLIACLGLSCGAITHGIGIHSVLGFFIAGIMAGNTKAISEQTREMISQTIHAIFVPVFFATIGIKVDFLQGIDVWLVLLFTAVAMGGKFIGAWIGARMARFSRPDAISIGIIFVPGGAMEIIVGILALEMRLIPESVFVAIVFAALFSSIAVGPLLAWSIRRREEVDVGGLLVRDAICLDLAGKSRWEVIPELCGKVAQVVSALDAQTLAQAVREREEIMGTGIEKGVAVPHARLKQLGAPLVAFGRSKTGIDWDARDGLATHFVFLILTPQEEEGLQVQILASIARVMTQTDIPGKIMDAESREDVFGTLNQALRIEQPPSRRDPHRRVTNV